MTETSQTPARSRLTAVKNFTYGLLGGVGYELVMSSPTETFATRTTSSAIAGILTGGFLMPLFYRSEKGYEFAERLTFGTSCATGLVCGQELTRAIKQYL